MLRFVKKLVWLLATVVGYQSAFGFGLIGPNPAGGNPDSYQSATIGYQLNQFTGTGIGTTVSTMAGYPTGDMGSPKNIGEGYRRNTPVIYYSFDASFLGFFGPRGAAEVDKAMAIYNSLQDVDSYSADLSEFPTDTRRVNFRASADSLLDIKSVTMGLVIEQLGPWEPTRWVWAIRNRTGTPCPTGMIYDIIKRNYDIVPSAPDQYQESSYVNGVLYSYFINEICSGANPLADAIEFPVDPLQSPYSAIADFDSLWYRGLQPGMFYTYVTRDDVGGLRYLMRTNNLSRETAGLRSEEFLTNSPSLITNQDLGVFAAQARTNDPAALAALYPGLIVTSTITNFFSLAITTNITQTLVNSPFDPAGAAPSHQVTKTTFTTNLVTTYQHTFANLITNTFATRGFVGVVTLSLSNSPFAPAGFPATTNVVVKITPQQGVFGTFFILPTNFCDAQVLSNVLTTVTITTNLPVALVPVVGAVNTNTVTFTPGSVIFTTNFLTAIVGVSCPTNAAGRFGGIEKIRFIRRDFDSLINQPWDPVTNDYTMVELVTNDVKVVRHFRRFVRRPDFLFTAADLGAATGFTYSNVVDNSTEILTITIGAAGSGRYNVLRTINFNETQRPSNLAGPGTIESPDVLSTLMIFDKTGPFFQNFGTSVGVTGFIDETSQQPFFDVSWGSFDGTTNAPVVYPNGSSLLDLEASLNGPVVTTRNLPDAQIGDSYTAQLAAAGGQAPYTWSLAPSSAGLPTGLSISSDGQITGIPSGPAAIYDFTVRVTDSAGAFRDVPFTISVF